MASGLLFGCDQAVASWAWQRHRLYPMHVCLAVGVLGRDGELAGAAIYQNYNGHSVDFSYYGEGAFTAGVVRGLAQAALRMGVARATLTTSKKNRRMLRFFQGVLRARLEGTSRRFYGHDDCPRSTAVRFALFREDLERLARGPEARQGARGGRRC